MESTPKEFPALPHPPLPLKPYCWVQVVTTYIEGIGPFWLTATTASQDRRCGLDALLMRHHVQLVHQLGLDFKIASRTIVFMNSLGDLHAEEVPLDADR